MDNKELIVVGSAFSVVIALAMYMFISQQSNNNMVKEEVKLEKLVEQQNAELKASDSLIQSAIQAINARLDETDEKFHKNQ
jgi:signal transduction histidine kinase